MCLKCLYLSSFKLPDSRPFDFNELIVSFRFENVACAYIWKWKFNKWAGNILVEHCHFLWNDLTGKSFWPRCVFVCQSIFTIIQENNFKVNFSICDFRPTFYFRIAFFAVAFAMFFFHFFFLSPSTRARFFFCSLFLSFAILSFEKWIRGMRFVQITHFFFHQEDGKRAKNSLFSTMRIRRCLHEKCAFQQIKPSTLFADIERVKSMQWPRGVWWISMYALFYLSFLLSSPLEWVFACILVRVAGIWFLCIFSWKCK